MKRSCIGSLVSHWAKKITMTDPQRAVISIMSYKMLHNLTKLLVSALTLLSEYLTIALFFSLDLFLDLLSVCLSVL